MLKAGLISGVLALIIGVIATSVISPLCTPCAVIFLGTLAGYLAGVFDKPSVNNAATKAGALGGTIAGVGAILGQLIGTAINGVRIGPQGTQEILQAFGLPNQPGFEQTYWVSLVGSGLCFSVLDILLMAGFGALGGILWWQMSGRNLNPPSTPPAPPVAS